MDAVEAVLDEIGALHRPRLLVFNKIDVVEDEVVLLGLRARYPGAIFVSALTREGLQELREESVRKLLSEHGVGRAKAYRA